MSLEKKYKLYKYTDSIPEDHYVYPIVDSMLEALSELPEWDPDNIEQIKLKFGDLRIYVKIPFTEGKAAEIIKYALVMAHLHKEVK